MPAKNIYITTQSVTESAHKNANRPLYTQVFRTIVIIIIINIIGMIVSYKTIRSPPSLPSHKPCSLSHLSFLKVFICLSFSHTTIYKSIAGYTGRPAAAAVKRLPVACCGMDGWIDVTTNSVCVCVCVPNGERMETDKYMIIEKEKRSTSNN